MSDIKAWAHDMIKYAVRAGQMKRQPCESCGAAKAQAHHDDYLKPREVRWLCVRCHRAWHREHGEAANADAPIPYGQHNLWTDRLSETPPSWIANLETRRRGDP